MSLLIDTMRLFKRCTASVSSSAFREFVLEFNANAMLQMAGSHSAIDAFQSLVEFFLLCIVDVEQDTKETSHLKETSLPLFSLAAGSFPLSIYPADTCPSRTAAPPWNAGIQGHSPPCPVSVPRPELPREMIRAAASRSGWYYPDTRYERARSAVAQRAVFG